MRRGLYFVLMLVLVLRGLTGTAMAAGVMPPLSTHAMAQQQQVHEHLHDELHDAHAHAGAADVAHNSHHSAQAAQLACNHTGDNIDCAAQEHHSSTCSACEICHSAMLDTPARLPLACAPTGTSLPLAAAPFDSAPAALVIKPPIA